MKKLFLLAIAIVGFSAIGMAQDISKNAIGLRIGDNDGLGTEITYQRGLNANNRLEIDLGFRSNDGVDAIKLTGIYQWVWNIDGGFNWYAGVGGGIASYSADNPFGDDFDETYIFAAGDVGIEYNFDAPWLISLDFRPELGFGDFNDDTDFDIAFSVRYQF